jgi:xanthine dehydrogenase accessory factor
MKNADGSWEAFDDYVLDFALERMRPGERVALVTLVKIEGSSPRPIGAQMAVSETGEWVGYLSGGCIERAVVAEAMDAIAEGKNRTVRYGRGSKYIDIQLPCGSAIELVFDVETKEADLAAIDARLEKRLPAVIKVPMPDDAGDEWTLRQYQPRRKLIVAGVGPATVQLARMATIGGFDVTVWSYDQPTLQRLASQMIKTVALTGSKHPPRTDADARTAIVFMFHDHEWELEMMPSALGTSAFYIGAMGSRATHRLRVRQLAEMGISEVQIGRIHGPAGLFAGSKSAGDIALSILAEIMQIAQADETSRGVVAEPSVGVPRRDTAA